MHDRTEQSTVSVMRRRLRVVPPSGQLPAADPWAELAAHPEISFARAKLPDGQSGRYYRDLHAIVLDDRLDPAQERVTLWHELLHAERRDDCSISDADHEAVDREAHARAGVPYSGVLAAAAPVMLAAVSHG
jgi:Zn-dependent peptidase ImmA (M78 family)